MIQCDWEGNKIWCLHLFFRKMFCSISWIALLVWWSPPQLLKPSLLDSPQTRQSSPSPPAFLYFFCGLAAQRPCLEWLFGKWHQITLILPQCYLHFRPKVYVSNMPINQQRMPKKKTASKRRRWRRDSNLESESVSNSRSSRSRSEVVLETRTSDLWPRDGGHRLWYVLGGKRGC